VLDMNRCRQCDKQSLYKTEGVLASGGYGPDLLPGIASSWGFRGRPKFQVVVCSECGLTQFHADEQTRTKLSTSDKWTKI
jgi:ribosomal protein L37E